MRDEGIGLPPNFDARSNKGLGMRLVNAALPGIIRFTAFMIRKSEWAAAGMEKMMKALTWHGKHDIRCETVPDPQD